MTINEKILNAQLPASVYRLCPDIPADLQQPNFKPIDYVNAQLKDKQFSSELLSNLISDVDSKIQQIDKEIEKIICDDDDAELPDIQQTAKLFSDLKQIQQQVEDTQRSSSVFIEKMSRFNQARRQIDYLAMNIECCKRFQDESKELPTLQFPQDSKAQIALIKPFATLCCIQQYLVQLQDVPQLVDAFKQFNLFMVLVKQMKPSVTHLQDPFTFWTTYSIKFGFLLAMGEQQSVFNEVSHIVQQEAFLELTNDSPITNQFVQKFEMFFKTNSRYLLDFEKVGVEEVIAGRQVYNELLAAYGQGRETAVHQQKPEIYITDSEQIAKLNNIYAFFFQNFTSLVIVKLNLYLSRSQIEEVVKTMKNIEKLEQLLTQDDATTVKQEQLTSIFSPHSRNIIDFVLGQVDSFVNGSFLQQIQVQPNSKKPLHVALYTDTRNNLQKMFSYLEFVPRKIELNQANLITTKYTDLVTGVVLPALEKRLNFSQYVSQTIEKQTKYVNSKQFAVFYELIGGQVQPIINLETFRCSGLMPVDFSEAELAPLRCICDLVKTHCYVQLFFANVQQQLQARVEGLTVENKFQYSDADIKYQTEFEQAICSLVVGQFVGSSFYAQVGKRQAAMAAAKEVFLAHYKFVSEELTECYDEMQVKMLQNAMFSCFVEQIGGFIVGQLVALQTDDFIGLKKQIEQISVEMGPGYEAILKKISQIILIRTMKLDGKEVDRPMFKTLMGDMQDCAKWYDEVVMGFVQQK